MYLHAVQILFKFSVSVLGIEPRAVHIWKAIALPLSSKYSQPFLFVSPPPKKAQK